MLQICYINITLYLLQRICINIKHHKYIITTSSFYIIFLFFQNFQRLFIDKVVQTQALAVATLRV